MDGAVRSGEQAAAAVVTELHAASGVREPVRAAR